ncbi:MAG: methyltransferase domain-containing protein [Proteobacteria bacterium]|nr:methyltransferase domain-containing protein [Pseudomonadota bacterium]
MFAKIDPHVIDLLCCPFCKANLNDSSDAFICSDCGLGFPIRRIQVGKDSWTRISDFRIPRPHFCIPSGQKLWLEAQKEYKSHHNRSIERDSLQDYLDEIDSVKEIYRDEFNIKGNVLDVGGHQGRLRHYLNDKVNTYISIDPFIDIFERMDERPNLIKAYNCLTEPCNFLSASAEFLPFKSRSFDWIHMRSVVDHFADPFLAFLEAFRCCKSGGRLLVGLTIKERIAHKISFSNVLNPTSFAKLAMEKIQKEGYLAFKKGAEKLLETVKSEIFKEKTDDHMFRLTYSQLLDLHAQTGWHVTKEHWQKPPFEHCIYICSRTADNRGGSAATPWIGIGAPTPS